MSEMFRLRIELDAPVPEGVYKLLSERMIIYKINRRGKIELFVSVDDSQDANQLLDSVKSYYKLYYNSQIDI